MTGSKVNDILIYLSVVEAGNFVAGGKALGLSRSTAGKAVARLESRYGVRLLNRTTRTLSLTEEGRKLYEQGKAIKRSIDAADSSMLAQGGEPSGTLRIAVPDALGRKLILPVIRHYMSEWPDIRCEVSFSDATSHIIESGFDVAIRVGMTLPDQSIIARTLMTDRPILCASPVYFENREKPQTIEQLSTHSLLKFSSKGERQSWRMQDETEIWGNVSGKTRLRIDNAQALHEATLAGMGITLLPSLLVQKDISGGSLVRVLPEVELGTVPIIALYPHKKFLEPKVRHFIDLLAKKLSKYGA